MPCNSCELLNINGLNCHETGCPDAWKDYEYDCRWCGSKLVNKEESTKFCDIHCYCMYSNLECQCGCQNQVITKGTYVQGKLG